MQECMRRDTAEKERLQQENLELRKDNTQMAIEIEQFREQLGALFEEREQASQQLNEFYGIKEQLMQADTTMAQQHEMIVQLQ